MTGVLSLVGFLIEYTKVFLWREKELELQNPQFTQCNSIDSS
jgi:hypothetical protein